MAEYLVKVPPHAKSNLAGGDAFCAEVDTGDELVVVHDWKYELRERTQLNRRP